MAEKKKWRKVLYEDQGVPDNYTDESFLDEMKKNVNTRMYDLRSVIYESGVVSQQLSTICIFVSIFYYMDTDVIYPNTVLLFTCACCMVGNLICSILTNKQSENVAFILAYGSYVRVSIFVFMLSPILKTLTKTISTDTIYAMSTGMFCANILFHDYGAGVVIVSKVISLNASIFAAVCLASRLKSSWHVYVIVMVAIVLFALFPEFRKDVKGWHRKAYILLTELLVLVATTLLTPISLMASISLVLSHFTITFVFPLWMVRLQKLKK